MTIQELIILLSNKLTTLNSYMQTEVSLGNLEQIEKLNLEIKETDDLLNKIKTLQ